MKKAKFSGKLNLNKETVAKLNQDQMKNIDGGAAIPTKLTQSCLGGCSIVNCSSITWCS